jgi:hypothetical protein
VTGVQTCALPISLTLFIGVNWKVDTRKIFQIDKGVFKFDMYVVGSAVIFKLFLILGADEYPL